MHRLVLVLLLMLLPLQWSDAAAAWHGEHQAPVVLVDAGLDASPVLADGEAACSPDCPLEDPMGPGALMADVPLPHAASPRFDDATPIESHIPAGPERPDRSPAA